MENQVEHIQKVATINDVARLANTSAATVSRVLSKSGYPVNRETAQRVEAAARSLNYTPNLAGHLLKSRSAKTLGLVIPSFQNPFFLQLVAGIEDAAASRDYITFVFNSRRSAQMERSLIQKIALLRIRGLLLSSLDPDSSVVESFLASGGSVALFEADYELKPCQRVINAIPDMTENSAIAVQALYDNGHRRIALLTTPVIKHNRRMVSLGYQNAMQENGLSDHCLVLEASSACERDNILYEFETGRELGNRFLRECADYTAIVAVNDLVACGVAHQLTANGVRVPDDVSIIGIDNIPQDIMMTPTISTVDQNSYRHGYDVCLRLIDALEHPDAKSCERYYIPPKLILRGSVKSLGR